MPVAPTTSRAISADGEKQIDKSDLMTNIHKLHCEIISAQ